MDIWNNDFDIQYLVLGLVLVLPLLVLNDEQVLILMQVFFLGSLVILGLLVLFFPESLIIRKKSE